MRRGAAPLTSTQCKMKRQQNRTIGAFEKTFWLLDQIDSRDFCLAADISGTQPVEKWEQEVEKELSIRSNTAEGPLLRVVLVQKTDCTVLILAANHIVADGTSLSYLTRDILLAVTGNELALLEPQVSNDETLGLPEDVPAQIVEKVLELKMKLVSPVCTRAALDLDDNFG